MNIKTATLLALLTPCVAMLGACATHRDADDSMKAPAASSSMPASSSMGSSTASSTSGMSGGEMSFADMDKNHDGSVSKDELSASDMLYQHFSVADTDGNGKLSEAEVTKHRADMAASNGK